MRSSEPRTVDLLGDGPAGIKPSRTGREKPVKLFISRLDLGEKIMPLAYYLAAVDTILACLLTMAMGGWTGYLRGKHRIAAPAVVGHPQFERAHRIHLNTVENLALMIPFLWIASAFYGGQLPFWFGLLWVVSRILYAIGYAQANAQLRGPGAGIGHLALAGLLVLSVIGLT
jgi:glutathione S-transferase